KTEVTVTGGTFISDNSYALYEGIALKENGDPAAASSTAVLSIQDGEFQGNSNRGAVSINTANNKNVIFGGYFTSDPTPYLAPDCAAVATSKDGYTFEIAPAGENKAEVAAGTPAVETDLPSGASEEETALAE